MITAGNLTRRNFPTYTATRCHGPVRWYFAFCDGLDARVDVARSVDMLVQRGPPYHGEMSKVGNRQKASVAPTSGCRPGVWPITKAHESNLDPPNTLLTFDTVTIRPP
ncbi:hypothetical protein IG631_16017 [Alternaria alternata]|nr:hypothetical protein IG631_16017 [Alternaria alternata]